MDGYVAVWKEYKMANFLANLFSTGASSLVSAVGDAIDKNVTSDEERKEMLEILERAKGYLRSYIAKNLRIYTTPEIRLHEDKGIESSVRIQKILNDLGFDDSEEKDDGA